MSPFFVSKLCVAQFMGFESNYTLLKAIAEYIFLGGLREVLKSVVDPATGHRKGFHMPPCCVLCV